MKSRLYSNLSLTIIVGIIAASCSSTSVDKAAQLKKLKEQQATLAKEVASLEKDIAATDTTTKVKMKEVVVIDLAPRKFDQYVQTQGSIESTDNIMVSAKSMGVLSQVYVREGDAVVRGQTLAQIDNSLTQRGIEEVKSSMELVNTVYERQKNLWDQKIGTEVQYLQAKNNKESLERRLATLNEQLDMSKIKSPINGTIDQVNVKIGENAAPGMPAFRVINGNDLRLSAKVSEAYISTIKKGNRAMISFSDYDKKIEAPLTFVGRNIDQLSRSFTIEAKLPASNELRPNMTAVVKIVFSSLPAALCVPVNVVQEINNEKVVYVAESDGKQAVARKKVVQINGIYDNLAQVTSGLKAGDKVITVGYQGLNDGELIKM
jgi:membrane fusion protein, multidrug efflux system